MNRRWFLAGLAAAAVTVVGVPAEARMHAPYRAHRIVLGGAPPLDGLTQPAAAYSFRKLRSAYVGPAVRIRRASDNAELDINFLGFVPGLGAPWDAAAASAHCAATNCFVRFWYDQSGAAAHLDQSAPGSPPQFALVLNCWGSLPCMQATSVSYYMSAPTSAPVAPVTYSVVGERTTGAGNCVWRQSNLLQPTAANTWEWNTTITASGATDGVRHAVTAVANGASSVLAIDGTETLGTAAAVTGAAPPQIVGNDATTCKFAEWILWSGYALAAGERTALRNNQRNFWGTP